MAGKTKATRTARTTDVEQVKELLLWARKYDVHLVDISLGSVHVTINDYAPSGQVMTPRASDEDARQNLYRQFGGALLDDVTKDSDENSTIEDDGLED